jgi:hypothetical protein
MTMVEHVIIIMIRKELADRLIICRTAILGKTATNRRHIYKKEAHFFASVLPGGKMVIALPCMLQ